MRKKIQDEFVVNAQKIRRKTTKIGNFVDRSKYGSYNYFISLVRAAERMPRGRST